MTYGIQFKNASGQNILNAKEIPVLYWGKQTHSLTANQLKKTPLFQLPDNIPVIIYSFTKLPAADTPKGNVAIWQESVGGKRHITLANTSSDRFGKAISATVTIYVFVPAEAIPLPTYGAVVYDNNRVQFHTGRPPQSIKGFIDTTYSAGSSEQSISGKLAAMATVIGINYFTQNTTPGYLQWTGALTHTTAYQLSTTTATTSVALATTSQVRQDGVSRCAAASVTRDGNFKVTIPYIDCTHYDQFPSLGNYT